MTNNKICLKCSFPHCRRFFGEVEMSVGNYVRPSEDEHKAISTYLENKFFCYLDALNINGFDSDDEKEFIKRFIKITSTSFGKSQESISIALKKGDHAVVSHGTKRINWFLKNFCEKKVSPPVQIFFHHLNPKGEKKRLQCHLACSEGKPISTVKGSEKIYSHDILLFEQAKAGNEKETKKTVLESKPPCSTVPPEIVEQKNINTIALLLKSHQVIEAKNLLHKLDPLNPRVIFYKQLITLVSKPIRKLGNREAKVICKNLEVLMRTEMRNFAVILLHDIYEKYYCRLGRRFPICLPSKPSLEKNKNLPELELIDLVIKCNS